MSFDLVVAVDRDWGIGKGGGLPWPRLRADLAHFRRVTTEVPTEASTGVADGRRNAIVMGRKTWQSAEVAGRPLPKRWNLVVSRGELPAGVVGAIGEPSAALVVRSLDEAIDAAGGAKDIAATFVVGGAELYRLALADVRARWVYLTRVDGQFACDTHIPDLDAAGWRADPTWAATDHEDGGVRYRIERLAR